MLAKKTVKDQITLPKKIAREFMGIEYFDISASEGKIVLTPVSVKPSLLVKVQEKMKELEISEHDIEDAIEWARKKKHEP